MLRNSRVTGSLGTSEHPALRLGDLDDECRLARRQLSDAPDNLAHALGLQRTDFQIGAGHATEQVCERRKVARSIGSSRSSSLTILRTVSVSPLSSV